MGSSVSPRAVGVIEHENAVVVPTSGGGIEAEVVHVKAARALLIPNRKREMTHVADPEA